LEVWRHQSLPNDIDLARREYEKYLSELLRQSEFPAGAFTVTPKPEDTKSAPKLPNKQPIYTKLDFTVTGRAPLESLVALMRRFYTTGLLHQIKEVSIQRPVTLTQAQRERPRDLDITFTVEALVLARADNRPFLMPVGQLSAAVDLWSARSRGVGSLVTAVAAVSPGGITSPSRLAAAPRKYEVVAAKNIFMGPPPVLAVSGTDEDRPPDPEPLKYVYLTDITTNFIRSEAFLFDRMNNQRTRLRNSAAWNNFVVGDKDKPTAKGEVVKIEDRDVHFKSPDGKFYTIHIGQNLAEAMKKPLSDDKVREITGAKARAESDKPFTDGQ